MLIKRLRIAGFKSFVEPAELRIEPGLTGVVGPNGCGKSNLLEALRWTMGENSPKSMRGAGMDDVIFAGTASRPPRDFAEVAILAEVDGDEREVVRRIERGAGSAYRLDGRDVRAKDVALLFADAATGAHSPALVSQGRIGAVIAAKPAERRMLLEEAAGIAGLHVRRRDAEQKLRAAEANLERLDTIIADAEARAGQLRRQARVAERYRLLSGEIRVAEARMIFARWRGAAAAAEAAEAEAVTAGAAVERASAAEQAAIATQRDAAAALARMRADALVARDAAADGTRRIAALAGERDAAIRRAREVDEGIAQLADDRAREGTLASDAVAALERLAADTARLTEAIAQGAAAMPALDAALADAEREARDAEVALAQAVAHAAQQSADARVAAAALAAAEQRADRAVRVADEIDRALAALPGMGPLIAERDAALAATDRAKAQADAAASTLGAAEADERAAIDARDAADAARGAARTALASLDAELAALTRATERHDADRLLDHVRAAPGYERALAAALGDGLSSGLERWHGAETAAGDPPPPAGTEPLAGHVTAPAVLARRLAQLFVAAHDAGQPLAVGQRLVTRDGRLRRWDGFVGDARDSDAAERLERLNRLGALHAARPEAAATLEAADADQARAAAAVDEARDALAAARRVIDDAGEAARAGTVAADRAIAALDRLAGNRDDLTTRLTAAAAERDVADAERAVAADAIAALPDNNIAADSVAALRSLAERRRTGVADARAQRIERERGLAADRDRLAAATADIRGWKARAGDAARRIGEIDRRVATLADERDAAATRPAELERSIGETRAAQGPLDAAAAAALADERGAEEALRVAEATQRAAAETLAAAREARAGAAARAEAQGQRRVEMGRIAGERFECPAPVLPERAGFDSATIRAADVESADHDRLLRDRERIGPVNLVAEQELAELDASSTGNRAERDELGLAIARLRGSIGTLNREGRERLRAAFAAVDGHFRRLFTTLFDGGQAHLAMVDSDDPLEAGLDIMAQPPGKRLQSLTLLSGGEQALTAVALIFALFLTNPAPICVLDEVDAPLDDANIERFCDLLDRMTRETETRYLIVTHNAVTMSRMDRLFGVTMVEKGVSRLVSVDLQAAERLVA